MKILAFPAFKNRGSNPYNHLLNSALLELGVDVEEFSFKQALFSKYDLIHVHWPEWYLNNPSAIKAYINNIILLIVLNVAKLRRKKLVWTVHNLRPHKIYHPILNSIFWRCFKKLVDSTLSLSEANKAKFLNSNSDFLDCHNAVTYHGLYEGIYVNDATKSTSMKKFGIDEGTDVCLFLGQLKPYKNIEILIDLFANQASLQDKLLLIAGKFDSAQYEQDIISQIGSAHNIKLFEGFVDNDDLQYYFSAAKVTVLPFKNIFNSGSALLSASFGRLVIVPESENFKEYECLLPQGLIHTYSGELTAGIIIKAFDENVIEKVNVDKSLEWISIAKATKRSYEEVLRRTIKS